MNHVHFVNCVHILAAATAALLLAGCAPGLRWNPAPPAVSVAIDDLRPVKDDQVGERPGAFGVPAPLRGDVRGTLRQVVADAAARALSPRPVTFSVEKLWCKGGAASAYTEIRGAIGSSAREPIPIEVHETTRDCDEGFQKALGQLRDLLVEILASFSAPKATYLAPKARECRGKRPSECSGKRPTRSAG